MQYSKHIHNENGQRSAFESGELFMREIINFLRNLRYKFLFHEMPPSRLPGDWKFEYVEIEITGRCNLSCTYCVLNNPTYRKSFSKDIDFDGLMNLLPQLKGKTYNLLLWGVGEPLLYENLDQVINVAKKYVPRVCLTSNGILLNRTMADKLAKSELYQLNISLDGPDSESNEMRKVDSEKILDNLEYFSRISRTRIDFWTVVAPGNLKKLPELACLKERIPTLHNLHFQMLIDYRSNNNNDRLATIEDRKITPRELSEMKKKVFESCKKYGLVTDVEELNLERIPKAHCNMPFYTLNINHKGYLTPCCMMFNFSLENALEMNLNNSINGPNMREFREEIKKGHYLPICERACKYKSNNPKKEWVERTEHYRRM
jgi:sulfatase maturation enzyme AslB (radical SAM superfamily)